MIIAIKDLPVPSNIDNLAEDKRAQILAFVHAVLAYETLQAAQSAHRAFRTEAGTGGLETSRAANEIAATNAQKLDLYRCAEDYDRASDLAKRILQNSGLPSTIADLDAEGCWTDLDPDSCQMMMIFLPTFDPPSDEKYGIFIFAD